MDATALPDGLIPLIKNSTRVLVLASAVPGSTGPQRVEQMTGFSAGAISRWQGDAHKELVPIETVFLLEHLTQKPIFARALAALTGHRLVPIAEDDPAPELDVADLLAVTRSASRFQSVLAEALQDGKITAAERRTLAHENADHLNVMATVARKLSGVED